MQMYNPFAIFFCLSVDNFTGSTAAATTVSLSQTAEAKGRTSPNFSERCVEGEGQMSKTCSSSYQT
jgi:hypothetical protein